MSSQHHQQQPAAPVVRGAHRRKGAQPTRRTSTSDGATIQQVPSIGGSLPPGRQPSADSDGSVSDDIYDDDDDEEEEHDEVRAGAGGAGGREADDGA